jgi:23S rRNA (uracil1939-C5)-methyltransferase
MTAATLFCEHAARCPGCALIGLAPAAQLAAKVDRVARSFAAYPSLAALHLEPVRAADSVAGYRTRAKLAVAPGPRVGLFARGTHDVIDLPGCRVLAPVLAATVATLRRMLAAPPSGAEPVLRAEGDGSGRLRAVDLREVRDARGAGVLLTLVLRAPVPSQRALDAACDALLAALPPLRAIAVSLHDGRSPQLLGAAPRGLRGAPLHRDVIRPDAPWTLVAPGSFAQAHRAQAAAIHAEIERALGNLGGLRVLDVFAGSGALGLALAARGADVTLVESFAPAAEATARAAREQDLAARVTVVAAPAEQAVPRLAAGGARFDVAIVNPPRRGVAARVRAALAELCDGPLVYVSCEPVTLARDLAHWAQLGLAAERVAPFDLMPQTAEVECVAWLRRATPPALAVLFEDDDLLAVDASPFAGEASGVSLLAKPAMEAVVPATTRWLALVRGVAAKRQRNVRRVEVVAGHALVEMESAAGGAEAVCRRLARAGQPVLGDERHGHAASNRHFFERHFLDRPFLHRASIEVEHPRTGAVLRIESPLAPDLAAVLARLRAAGSAP